MRFHGVWFQELKKAGGMEIQGALREAWRIHESAEEATPEMSESQEVCVLSVWLVAVVCDSGTGLFDPGAPWIDTRPFGSVLLYKCTTLQE